MKNDIKKIQLVSIDLRPWLEAGQPEVVKKSLARDAPISDGLDKMNLWGARILLCGSHE